jgi:hypothetical protein
VPSSEKKFLDTDNPLAVGTHVRCVFHVVQKVGDTAAHTSQAEETTASRMSPHTGLKPQASSDICLAVGTDARARMSAHHCTAECPNGASHHWLGHHWLGHHWLGHDLLWLGHCWLSHYWLSHLWLNHSWGRMHRLGHDRLITSERLLRDDSDRAVCSGKYMQQITQ